MTDDRLKMWFGFVLTVCLIVLAGIVAIGHVMEQSSFGLQYILGALSSTAGAWSIWAFTRPKDKPDGDQDDKGNTDGRSE